MTQRRGGHVFGRARRIGRAWRWIAVMLPVVLTVTLANQLPALAKPAPSWHPPTPKDNPSVPVVAAKPGRPVPIGLIAPVTTAGRVSWPAAGTATVDLAAAAGAASDALTPGVSRAAPVTPVKATGLPVAVAPAVDGADPVVGRAVTPAVGKVTVAVSDRASTARVGVAGLLLSARRADGVKAAGAARVQVDYSSFAGAYGGDWASRLRLVQMPACALTTPDDPACRAQTPLPTTNNPATSTVTAQVQLAASSATVLAATAAASGDNGDYKATSLSPSATWQVSTQAGDFSWSYPLRVPPSLNGPAPQLSLSYDSGSVDGRTGATNNQPSWIGDGWDMWPGYIERSYRSCTDDQKAVDNQTPNNVGHTSGDLCWATDNATMSLNGQATSLVRDDATGTWRPKDDDGSRVERITGDSGRANGDNDNEYWKITTLDGTQYIFGYNRLPGWASGDATTNSVWTEPVFGNHPGEPCHASSYASSYCSQAWRWNLDYVIDPHGNTMAYYYQTESGAYGRDMTASQRTTYVRGGWLDHIDYGMRQGSEYSIAAPMRVNLAVADRCVSSCWTGGPAKPVTANWPDTPWDQDCPTSPCASTQVSPTFWSTKRLTTVTTQVRNGSGYRDVDSWALNTEYLNAGTSQGKAPRSGCGASPTPARPPPRMSACPR